MLPLQLRLFKNEETKKKAEKLFDEFFYGRRYPIGRSISLTMYKLQQDGFNVDKYSKEMYDSLMNMKIQKQLPKDQYIQQELPFD